MTAEVAVYDSNMPALPARVGVPGTQEFDSWVAIASDVIKLANHICDTPFVPDGMRGSAPACAAAILAGREMGLGPMTSLANIDVIKGRPSQKPVLMRALVQSRGHKWVDVEVSDVRVIIKGCRKGEAEWTEVTFTQAHAKLAGIDLGKYPADKLYARATSRLARRKFADVIMGMPYSDDEIEDGVTDDGEIIGTAPAAAIEPKPATAQRRTRRAESPAADRPSAALSASGSEGATPDRQPPAPATAARNGRPSSPATAPDQPPLPDEDTPGDPAGHDERHAKLVGVVQQHFRRLGYSDAERGTRLLDCERIAGSGPLDSTSDLTAEALSVVADTLARCKTRAQLNALLAAGDKPGDQAGQDAAERAFKAGEADAS